MTCNLIRLRCERSYGPAGEALEPQDWPAPDYRLFDVPPGLANQIAATYRAKGWEVMEEPI